MKIRVVDFCRGDYDSIGSNSFLFKEKSKAVLYAQDLLRSEQEQSGLSDECFRHKEELYIDYYDIDNVQSFIIQVSQKEIK